MKVHGKTLVRTFRETLESIHGLTVIIYVGFSEVRIADEEATLASIRSEDSKSRSDQLALEASMTVANAEALVRSSLGFAIEILRPDGSRPAITAKLSEVGFHDAPPPPDNQGGTQGPDFLTLISAGANPIQVIKALREATGLGLKEVKDLIDSAPVRLAAADSTSDIERFRDALLRAGATVSLGASGPIERGARPGAFTVVSNPPHLSHGRLKVVLASAGPRATGVIRVLCENLGLGLRDAKDLVDTAPQVVLRTDDPLRAEGLKRLIELAGGSVIVH